MASLYQHEVYAALHRAQPPASTHRQPGPAAALHDQAQIRATRAELTSISPGRMTTAVSASHIQAAQLAESSIAARVEALERYAAEVTVRRLRTGSWPSPGTRCGARVVWRRYELFTTFKCLSPLTRRSTSLTFCN
jgi:hypothetical protein